MLRSLVLATALLSTGALATASPPRADVGKGCYGSRAEEVAGNGVARFHRLDTLPPANEILTVIHSVDGCQRPVIVRYDIGGNPRAR
jgi:hypothetical protein